MRGQGVLPCPALTARGVAAPPASAARLPGGLWHLCCWVRMSGLIPGARLCAQPSVVVLGGRCVALLPWLLPWGPALWPWQCLWVTRCCSSPQRNTMNYEQTKFIGWPWCCWVDAGCGVTWHPWQSLSAWGEVTVFVVLFKAGRGLQW